MVYYWPNETQSKGAGKGISIAGRHGQARQSGKLTSVADMHFIRARNIATLQPGCDDSFFLLCGQIILNCFNVLPETVSLNSLIHKSMKIPDINLNVHNLNGNTAYFVFKFKY